MAPLKPLCRYAKYNYHKADGSLVDCGNMPLHSYCCEHRCDPLKGVTILSVPKTEATAR